MDPQAQQLYNQGNQLLATKRLTQALEHFSAAVARQPGFALAWNNRGIVLRELGRPDEARASFTRAVAAQPNYAHAYFNRATAAGIDKKDYGAAIMDLERALALDPAMYYARGLLLHMRMHGCDWRDFDSLVAAVDEGVRSGAAPVEPFVYQAVSQSPSDLRACAAQFAASRYPAATPLWRPRNHDKIRLGYVSGEFRAQATAYLAARLYELHDRGQFEVIAVDNGASDGSAMRARLESAFDGMISIRMLSDEAAAARIADAEIDILINLNGYFGEDRMGVFAHRPAPLQVNYLGFPGTLGASYMDYIIADKIVLPMDEACHYDEQVAWLPDSYQVNDNRRQIALDHASRTDCGLPESGFVFCNFNNAYKLTPTAFSLWMRILKQVPGSVLWLLENNPLATANLRAAALRHGVAGERLVFASHLPLEAHLARVGLADLFLDLGPYNAHTTASDALWAGVPLLTCRGTAFAGRVGASLLQAVGLPELVTESLADYEALALRLARQPQTLNALRQKLAQNRYREPLFDTVRTTRNIEAAYSRMWQIFLEGRRPEGFSVPL